MRKLAALSLMALAACASLGEVRPETVRLGGDQLAVVFQDGVTCRATVPLAGGTGRFEDCVHPADWSVRIVKRNYLEPFLGATVSPYAYITITDGSGRVSQFRTPPLPGYDD